MAAKKKRRASNNGLKRSQRMFGNSWTWTWQGLSQITSGYQTRAYTRQFGSVLPMDLNLQYAMYRQSMNWILGMRALCQSPNGDIYVESVTCTVRNFSLKELEDSTFNLMDLCIEDLKTDHIVDVGWLAHTFVGQSWEPDDQAVGRWVVKGLEWKAPIRKQAWQTLNTEMQEEQWT